MKKHIIKFTIGLAAVTFLVIGVITDSNFPLAKNQFLTLFRPTVQMDLQVDLEQIKEIRLNGLIDLESSFTDKAEIQKVIDCLNGIVWVESKRDELANISPDVWISFIDYDDNIMRYLCIYGGGIMEDRENNAFFRSKYGNPIWRELEKAFD